MFKCASSIKSVVTAKKKASNQDSVIFCAIGYDVLSKTVNQVGKVKSMCPSYRIDERTNDLTASARIDVPSAEHVLTGAKIV